MAEIVGIGSLLADQIIQVDDSFLSKTLGQKGGMEYTHPDRLNTWITLSGQSPPIHPGGSAANVLRGLAQFGHACSLISKVGDDPIGKQLADHLKRNGISLINLPNEMPTGQCLSLVTPDGQRTMRVYLGASGEWSASDLKRDYFEGVRLLHIEGYTILHKGLASRAMSVAKEAGALVSLDLSSFEVAARHKDEILGLMADYVDILFANEDETRMLTGCPPQRGCSLMKDICQTAVVMMGPGGCWVGHEGIMYQCPAYPVEALDTTGAGDMFTSGFLHGYLKGLPLPECAHIGALAGRAVVQVLGATLKAEQWEDIKLLSFRKPPEFT